jgi:hypothetical protein
MNRFQSIFKRTPISERAASLLAALGYALLVLLFAWPLPANLADRVVLARGSDFYQHIWNLWWMRFSLFTLHQNPYHTGYLDYPTGQPLTYHVLDPLDGLLSLPLQATLGLVPAFNLLRLWQLLFAALAAYALCRLVGLPRLAAWAGGALFAFCPLVGSSFDFGQLVEISVGWLPLYIFCLIKALGNRALGIKPGSWGWIVGAALSLAASALSTWYFFTSLVLFTLLYVAWESASVWWPRALGGEGRRTKDEGRPELASSSTGDRESLLDAPGSAVRTTAVINRQSMSLRTLVNRQSPVDELANSRRSSVVLRLVGRAALIGVIACVVLSPLLVAVLRENATGADYTITPFATIVLNSADLLSFFMPLPSHVNSGAVNPGGANPALGWLPMLLAAAGLVLYFRSRDSNSRSVRPHLLFWLAAALLFALFALGPHLLVAGNDTHVPLPYDLLNRLPFLGAGRVPLRFTLLASLALAVLAAYGLMALWNLLGERRYRPLLFAALGVLLVVELFGIPRTTIAAGIDPFFQTIKANGTDGANDAVLELPYDPNVAPAMYDQTQHQHPIVGAYTSRHYPFPWVRAVPGVSHLTQFSTITLRATDILTPQVRDTALPALDYYGIRYIVVHPLGNEGMDRKIGLTLETLFEAHNIAPIYKDDSMTVYKVPPQHQTGPIAGLGDGWYLPEQSGTRQWRAIKNQAQVLVTNPLTRTMPVTLTLSAFTEGPKRSLTVSLDGEQVGEASVGPGTAQSFSMPLDLPPGEHWLQLDSPEAPYYLPHDPHPRTISFEQVAVLPR